MDFLVPSKKQQVSLDLMFTAKETP